MTRLFVFCILATILSCHEEMAVDPDSYTCGQVNTLRLRDMKGVTIRYAKPLDEYYINFSADTVPDDEKIIAVFCELPEVLKVEGRTINFDGKFSNLNTRDSTERDNRLRRFFQPARVMHVGILKLN